MPFGIKSAPEEFQHRLDEYIEGPVLHYYNVIKEVIIECDSSDVGLGAVITQEGYPIAYASRALTQTERNYAQIEKECLAIVFASERFEHYILGKETVRVLTDHKPLVTIFKKPILTCPKRLQRMRLRLQKFSLNVEYQPGPKMYISDTLSRASLPMSKIDSHLISYHTRYSRPRTNRSFEQKLKISTWKKHCLSLMRDSAVSNVQQPKTHLSRP